VPFCGGGNLCERLWKGLSQMDDGGHMQSVHALHVKDMFQKYHVALSIARALCHCHELDIVHSDLCCCNILLTRDKEKSSESSDDYWLVKIANTGVYPDSDSLDNRRVYLAPELLSQLPIQHPISSSHAHGKSAKSSFIEMSPPHVSPNSPPLHSSPSAGGSGPPITFSKESDVYALGITLLQLFRHTLVDCKDEMCAVAASQTPSTLTIPLIPKHFATTLFPPLPTSLQSIISSCTMRNPDDRPSAAEIRCANMFIICPPLFLFMVCFAYVLSYPHRLIDTFQSALGIGHRELQCTAGWCIGA
jgi:serine/threonine protein kinase